MKLLLKEQIRKLGRAGDVVDVKDGFGRNYLLPQGLAIEVTPGNLQRIEMEKKRLADAELAKLGDYKVIAERITATDITITKRVHNDTELYGSIATKDILEAMQEKGLELKAEWVELDTPIKTTGAHHVKIVMHPDAVAELKIWVVAENAPTTDDEDDEAEDAVAEEEAATVEDDA